MNKEQMRAMIEEIREKTMGLSRRAALAAKLEALAAKLRKAAAVEDCVWSFGEADGRCPVDLFLLAKDSSLLESEDAEHLCWGIRRIADELCSDYHRQQQVEQASYRRALENQVYNFSSCKKHGR